MTTQPTVDGAAVAQLAREFLAEAFCVLRAQRNKARDALGALWGELPGVKTFRDMAASLRLLAEQAEEVAGRIEELQAKGGKRGG